MPKLKTYGVITEEELKQAEREGHFSSLTPSPARIVTKPSPLI